MAISLGKVLKEAALPTSGIINVAKGQQFSSLPDGIRFNYARHPVPDEDGQSGVQEMMKVIDNHANQLKYSC